MIGGFARYEYTGYIESGRWCNEWIVVVELDDDDTADLDSRYWVEFNDPIHSVVSAPDLVPRDVSDLFVKDERELRELLADSHVTWFPREVGMRAIGRPGLIECDISWHLRLIRGILNLFPARRRALNRRSKYIKANIERLDQGPLSPFR